MDFIAGNHETNTAGLSWTMTSSKPELSGFSMANSLSAPQPILTTYTALPSTLPSLVQDLAQKVTARGTSDFERAVLLQNWFRTTGHFRYSLATKSGDGTDALLTFLARTKDGRVGYCEQFASAFAVMARTLSIPARVAVGFLQPTQAANGDWIYSAHDLHAWPEVYFHGSGWVRFEPTPAARRGTVPPLYTVQPVRKPGHQQSGPSGGGKFTSDPTNTQSARQQQNQSGSSSSSSSGLHVPWLQILGALAVLVLLGGIALVPGGVRRARRRRRLAGGAEGAWAELRDSAIDLGVGWPSGRSPHETGHQLVGWFGAEPDGPAPVRPPRGRGLAPGAEDALDRIVLTLERVRYARRADDVPGALADDVRTCIEALEHGSNRRTLRRAAWLPRSLFGASRTAAQTARDRQPEVVATGGVVDHVG
jgi:hypothetical protein